MALWDTATQRPTAHDRRWQRWIAATCLLLWASLVLVALRPDTTAGQRPDVVVVETTIQAAVDRAAPGATILVPAGVYREAVVVRTSNLTLLGAPGAIIDAAGHENGITVGPGRLVRNADGGLACPAAATFNVTVAGLTVRNAAENGILLGGVDGFRVLNGAYIDNAEYGIYPICSRNGVVAGNVAEGSHDAAIYVGESDHVEVLNNVATRSTTGIEVTNATDVRVAGNRVAGNTAGMVVVVLPGLPLPGTERVTIEQNTVLRNNLPNPVAGDPAEILSALPSGLGIVNLGGDRVIIRENVVLGNRTAGIAVLPSPVTGRDGRSDPNPDFNEVRDNTVLGNGADPDPSNPVGAGADVVHLPGGMGTCFANNTLATELLPGVTAQQPCPEG